MKLLRAIRIRLFLLLILLNFLNFTYSENYYWVGDSGNWSDINHWATTSGGSVFHNTPPSPNDDVFFDSNSFNIPGQTVTVNTENALCKTLDWSTVIYNPVFVNTTSVNIDVFGSLILSPDMEYEYGGSLTFQSTTTNNDIITSGHILLYTIIFNGIGGAWTLQDNLTIEDNIFLNYGAFYTNNKTIICNGFSSSTTDPRELILGSSTIILNGSWALNSTGLLFDSGTSILYVGLNLSNSGNGELTYNSVVFQGGVSTLNNQNVYVFYDSINFQYQGVMQGDCSVNYLEFELDGSIYNSDTIRYVQFNSCATNINLINGNHNIDTSIFLCDGLIQGQNKIHYAIINEKGTILENNQIDYLKVGDTAFIQGSNSINYLFLNKMGFIRENNFARYAFFNCDGSFVGNNTFDTLTFNPGFEYIFEKETTQTINKQWNINGTCEAPIFIKSSYNGINATVHSVDANISGSNISIRDIEAIGNTPFVALQSVDLGNNLNWNVESATSRDLYWVNGQGNWNDPNHWDIVSDGSGGHCPPTELDNTFFDGSSANPNDTVFINTRNAVCHNTDWTGVTNPVLFGPDTNNMKFYGSLIFDPAMDQQFLGETFFEDVSGDKTVFTAEKLFLNHVWFNGTDGEWTLLDIFQCEDTIYHERGSVSTDGYNIQCNHYSSADTNHRKLYLHSDTVKLTGQIKVWELDGANFELHADSSVLLTISDFAEINSRNAERLVYNNVHQNGLASTITNDAYCVYNLVTHQGAMSTIFGPCTIDTSIMYGDGSGIYTRDTIKTAIFYGAQSLLKGNHIVEIAYYYLSGSMEDGNRVDTALFYDEGIVVGYNRIDTTIIFKDANITGRNIIRTATLKDKGWFYGNNEFNDLTLSHAKKYIFQHDSTQLIKDNWNANGRCTGNIIIMSDFDGKQAIIEKENGNVEIEYANLRDIKASGITPFIANNSIDLGNNENWEINMAEPLALYWIGGTGNWSDSLHWAPISGGQGPYCIPSPIDDVYFDQNSFLQENDTVYIDIENATCRNMSWTGSETNNPVFDGEVQNNLFIYGSLLLNNTMQLNYSGITFFESLEKGRTIETKEKLFKNHIVFQGRTGGWSFIDDFSTLENIHHVYGDLTTNNQNISCKNFISVDTNQRDIDLMESELYIEETWQLNARNLTFDGDSSVIYSGTLFKSFDGEHITYNNVHLLGSPESEIRNDSVYCYFNYITLNNHIEASVSGNCYIDTVVFEPTGNGTIFDSDSINFAHFKGTGTLDGQHYVLSAIYEGDGQVTGTNEVLSAIFNANGSVVGYNTIDTTIIYGNGSIHGDNLFKKFVEVYGAGFIQGNNVFNSSLSIYQQGTLSGNNIVENNLVIHGHANIFGDNLINDALLLDWGDLGGANIFDTLTFTPGNEYTLTNGQTQTVNHQFNIRGNNCFPIILKSLTNGMQANIFMDNDTVSGDFIEMTDINAIGGALFYAGGNSKNNSNNSGWIWEDAPGYIYGLGLDYAYICEGDELLISTEDFNGNPDTQYQWHDGTISPTYTITEPGIYNVLAIYSEDCKIPDTITVELLPAPELELGEDREICEGESIDFTPTGEYTDYLWNDGSAEPTIPVDATGEYWLEVTGTNGCKNSDTVFVNSLPVPVVDLGIDVIIYNHETITLDAGHPGSFYEWSTGETTQTIEAMGVEDGEIYWVLVEKNGCKGYDEIIIDEYPECYAAVPTAFSPNGDTDNDVLTVFSSGFSQLTFIVYDRYGALVFETNDPNIEWDGTLNGAKQEKDVYTYYLKAICEDGFIIEEKGNITLLR